MARRTSFRLTGFSTWVENIKNTVSEEAARRIVDDLKWEGPYWSGDFEAAWVVRKGSTPVRATRRHSGPRLTEPRPWTRTDFVVPPATGRKSINYTIGNEMEYRNVAMDLEPGRIKGGGNETAPQDWYSTYVEGGKLRAALQQATNRAAQNPKIRGFKG